MSIIRVTKDTLSQYKDATGVGYFSNLEPGSTVYFAPGEYQLWASNQKDPDGYFDCLYTGANGIRYVSEQKFGAKLIGLGGTGNEMMWHNQGNDCEIIDFEISSDSNHSCKIGILNHSDRSRIIGNIVHTFYSTDPSSGGGCIVSYGRLSDVIGNIVFDIGGDDPTVEHGIYYTVEGGNIWNNIVRDISGHGIQLYHNPTNVSVSNNLIMNCGLSGIAIGTGDTNNNPTPCNNCLVANNIVINTKDVAFSDFYRQADGGAIGDNNRAINNLWYMCKPPNWPFGVVANTINSDPGILLDGSPEDTSYYRMQSGPTIDTGVSPSDPRVSDRIPRDDYDGTPRPKGSGWDIGPFEFVKRPSPRTNVAGLESILSLLLF